MTDTLKSELPTGLVVAARRDSARCSQRHRFNEGHGFIKSFPKSRFDCRLGFSVIFQLQIQRSRRERRMAGCATQR
ncbi:MAG TPA: hypothetical protein VKX17_27710 [Planctomycetota bacterium]|nr:hypothetical protein [Planctomycetota bacterium]